MRQYRLTFVFVRIIQEGDAGSERISPEMEYKFWSKTDKEAKREVARVIQCMGELNYKPIRLVRVVQEEKTKIIPLKKAA